MAGDPGDGGSKCRMDREDQRTKKSQFFPVLKLEQENEKQICSKNMYYQICKMEHEQISASNKSVQYVQDGSHWPVITDIISGREIHVLPEELGDIRQAGVELRIHQDGIIIIQKGEAERQYLEKEQITDQNYPKIRPPGIKEDPVNYVFFLFGLHFASIYFSILRLSRRGVGILRPYFKDI